MVDERDTMFARMARRPGTPPHDDYYARRPELRDIDDRLRALPELGEPGGRYHDPTLTAEAQEHFDAIGRIEPDRDGVQAQAARIDSSASPAAELLQLCRELGAVAAGIAPVREEHLYSHKGRFDADYGRPVPRDCGTGIVFLVEMSHRAMQQAPRASALRESAWQYLRAARIARTVQAVLQRLGHRARSQHDAHYDLMLPPLAVEAGLGELGRNNLLVAPRFGSRVRIGAVTTDWTLPASSPVDLGVVRFCQRCRKCAESCPSRALSLEGREEVRGVRKWPTDVERCYRFWRTAGTDCGICMACCPFSHRDSLFHNSVRWLVRRVPVSHPLLLAGEDLVYGRRWPLPPASQLPGR